MTRVRYLPAILIAMAASAGCDEKLREFAGPTPNLQPTLTAIERDVFSAADSSGRPGCVNCHNAARPLGGLNLSAGAAFAALVNVPSSAKPGAIRVVPGNPEATYLLHKIEGRSDIVGTRMPRNGPFLTPNQIFIIRRWIELGAPNN